MKKLILPTWLIKSVKKFLKNEQFCFQDYRQLKNLPSNKDGKRQGTWPVKLIQFLLDLKSKAACHFC